MNFKDAKEIYDLLGFDSKIDRDNPPKTTVEVEQMVYDALISLQLEVANKLLVLSEKIAPKCQGTMRDVDLKYLCKLSFLRQMDHMRAVIILAKERNSDVSLIARSMFEGALYFFYLSKDESLLREWRLYACVVVARQIDEAIANDELVPDDIYEALKPFKPEIDAIFRKKSGQFFLSWKKDMSILGLAKKTDKFEHLYKNQYEPLSDYHHWGSKSLAYHYHICDQESDFLVGKGAEVLELMSNGINVALSCLFSMIEASVKIFETGDEVLIAEAREELKKLPFSKVY